MKIASLNGEGDWCNKIFLHPRERRRRKIKKRKEKRRKEE